MQVSFYPCNHWIFSFHVTSACDNTENCKYNSLPGGRGISVQKILMKWVCVEIQHIWKLSENRVQLEV